MIREVAASDFLAAPGAFEASPCIALAAVVSDAVDEAAALEGWSVLRSLFTGSGTRVGFRAFLALVQDTEVGARETVAQFFERRADHAAWHFVATPVSISASLLAALREVEWRAHKGVSGPETSALSIVKVGSTL